MLINRVEIRNFRSIRKLAVDLDETTVFVGPNNAGKTAILDALRIPLTRRWGERGTGFNLHDVHLASETADPRTAPGVAIELHAIEAHADEWPESVSQALDQIIQVEPDTGRRSAILRTTYDWNADVRAFQPAWQFLNLAQQALIGPGGRRTNLDRFWRYVPTFYLGALRDARDEFNPRGSQFWHRLLKAIEIPPEVDSQAKKILEDLDQRLLNADPRLGQVARTLSDVTRIAAHGTDADTGLRMTPLTTEEMLHRAEIIVRNTDGAAWLPLRRQGQGVQSLSVILLFQIFVEHLLTELYEPDSTPMLLLEEPETHLHPQAVRTLWSHIETLPGQKVIATHSPYFLQHAPLDSIRIVRLGDDGTWLAPQHSPPSVQIPSSLGLEELVSQSDRQLEYDADTERLTAHGPVSEDDFRRLARSYTSREDASSIVSVLATLRDDSRSYLTESDIQLLTTSARRLRGEIFLAERWLIVEGQSDHLIMEALAFAMNYPLDQHGVSLIDAKNSGNPEVFASLARAFRIPWCAVLDGDRAGLGYIASIRKRGFSKEEVNLRCRTHPAGPLELQLLQDGCGPVLRELMASHRRPGIVASLSDQELADLLIGAKTTYASGLAARLRSDRSLVDKMPAAFREAIRLLPGLYA